MLETLVDGITDAPPKALVPVRRHCDFARLSRVTRLSSLERLSRQVNPCFTPEYGETPKSR